ncbi:MAG: DNA replication and repair protein RecF [Melioribacteraceae bacterium]|nr:DNA replication and repair protein RecF [Melioribacteraceae bacterium]
MILKSIELKNFRLHKDSVLTFSENLNFIVGGNGQGKTTILEAIYYMCTTKSLNQSPDIESVNFEEKFFEIKGQFEDLTKNRININFNSDVGKKAVLLDEKQIFRAADIIGKFPVVTLIQSDHEITQGSPGERRKFVDSIISQASETYLKIFIDYNKTLRQRSSLLNQIRETKNPSLYSQLDAWTSTLIKTGSEIIRHRIKFKNEFNEYVKNAYQKIMNTIETPDISYQTFTEIEDKNIEEEFAKELNKKKELELIRAKNLVGPHRDDFIFNVNNRELRRYGSQGQHKTFQIALRFAQFFYMKDTMGRVPIFLMDDIFGELDTYRAKKISEYLKEVGQSFITMTDFTNYSDLVKLENDKLIEVENGTVTYV